MLPGSSNQDLRHALQQFDAECEAAGMRISISESNVMVLSWKKSLSGERGESTLSEGVSILLDLVYERYKGEYEIVRQEQDSCL